MTRRTPRRHPITPTIAAHVLHSYGEGGYQAGSFTTTLIQALKLATTDNFAKLATVYPGYAAAVHHAANSLTGIASLHSILVKAGVDAP